jgi:DNA-binding CsgD family transcriptional regulator
MLKVIRKGMARQGRLPEQEPEPSMEARRDEAVARMLRGEGPGAVAESLGLNPDTVSQWYRRDVALARTFSLDEERDMPVIRFSLTELQAQELAAEFADRANLMGQQRAAFEATVAGADDAEIAKALHCTVSTARTHIERARAKLLRVSEVREMGREFGVDGFAVSDTNLMRGALN